jgi:hypothetical protein
VCSILLSAHPHHLLAILGVYVCVFHHQLLLVLDTVFFPSPFRIGYGRDVLYSVYVLLMGWMDGVSGWTVALAPRVGEELDGEMAKQWRLKQTGQVHLAGTPAYVTTAFVFFPFLFRFGKCIYVSFTHTPSVLKKLTFRIRFRSNIG